MKLLNKYLTLIAIAGSALVFCAAVPVEAQNNSPRIAIVNFKDCVERSKSGQQEQTAFDALKKKLESSFEDKEKALTELSNKFNDPDYMDGLSPEAEHELKHKYRTMTQEITQYQNQCYQLLSQSNMKVLQKLNELVSKAAQNVAKANNYDIILNDEAAFYFSNGLDISNQIIAEMDKLLDAEQKQSK